MPVLNAIMPPQGKSHGGEEGEGVLKFGLDRGLPLEPRSPSYFQGSFCRKKGAHFQDFDQNMGPFFSIFRCSDGEHPKI